ncbi:hypothetical protein ABPG75_013212 [Micractinium tetrahymenae]
MSGSSEEGRDSRRDSGDSGTAATTAANSSPHHRPGRSVSAIVSPSRSPETTNAALWRQNTELQQRCQDLALEVQGLKAASARRRLSTLSGSHSSSLLASRRGSSAASEEERGIPSQVAALEAQLAEARASAAAALAARQEAEAAAAVAQEDACQAQAERDAARQAAAAAQRQLAATQAELEAEQRAVATMQAELEAARAEAAVAQAGVVRLSEQLAGARAELSAAQSQAGEVEAALRGELSDLQARLVASEGQARRVAAQLAAAEQEAARCRAEVAGVRLELSDAHGTLAGAQAALADARAAIKAAEGKAASAAADRAAVAALEQRVAELLQQAEAAEKRAEQAQAAASSRAARPASRNTTRSQPPSPRRAASPAATRSQPSSPREYGSSSLSQLCSPPGSTGSSASAVRHHSTRIVCNVMLPSTAEGTAQSEAEGMAAIMRERDAEVATLWERLRTAESELARQLAHKQAAQLQVTALSAEVSTLHRERELLQEQAMSLQQEVSNWQTGSLLRGGPSGEEVAAEGLLERSPSRTLAARMRELLKSPRRLALDASPSSQGSFRPPNGSRSASPSPRGSPGASVPAELTPGSSPALGPLGEGERLRSLQQQVAALEQRLASKEAQLAEQAAGAAAALAAARDEYAGLKEQAAAAEAAAESVLRLRSSGAGAGAKGAAHQECRTAIEGIYAQMWRERLARQKAQAQAAELRQRLSNQQAEGPGGGRDSVNAAVPAADEVDEVVMKALQDETARADHVQDELRRNKSHQLKLEKRAEQLELQLAEYTTLLSAAEGVEQVPRLGGSLPTSPCGRSTAAGPHFGRYGSPVRGAITALQGRKAAEEAAALREQLKAAQAEVASVRRRERDSLAALKAARYKQSELHRKQQMLAAGLETLQRMARRGQGQPGSSASGTPRASASGRGAGQHSREASQLGDSAMAVLSALLRTLQSQETADGQVSIVSPQHSEVAPGSAGGAAEWGSADALTLQLPQEGPAGQEALSDPLDIASLLPEGSSGVRVGAAVAAAPAPAAAHAGIEGAQEPAIKAATPAVDARSASLSEPEPGCFTIQAVRSRQDAGSAGVVAVAASTSSGRSLSRIPAPPAKTGTSPAHGSLRSPRSNGKLSRLLAPCRHMSPHATLSSAAEAGRPSTQHHLWK